MEVIANFSYPVGSSYTCKYIPGFLPKDTDYLYYIPKDKLQDKLKECLKAGYKIDGNYEEMKGKFISLRKNTINIILSDNYLWCYQFLKANELCKKLQLADKDKRIAVHEAFLSAVA